MPRFERPIDGKRQDMVADRLAAHWKCDWRRMGPYSTIDVYMERDKQLVSVVEIRTRESRDLHTFPTVLVNMHKWHALLMVEVALHVPGIYALAFRDGIYYVRIGQLPVNKYSYCVRGRTDRPELNAPNDISPSIEVPSDEFKFVCPADGIFE